jgi:hypothetical protein
LTDPIAPAPESAKEIDELRSLLHAVTEQRDKLMSQYEGMALQTDESTREVDDALLHAKEAAGKAEASERRAQEEKARADALSGELDAERRKTVDLARELETERGKSSGLAAECARLREAAAQIPSEEHPLAMVSRGSSLLACEAVQWLRGKIPADSPLLPWFDRLVHWLREGTRLAAAASIAAWRWLKPRLIELWRTVKDKPEGSPK